MGEVVQRENAEMWPTPTVHGNNNFKGASAKSGDGLMTVVKRREGWPTPNAADAKFGFANNRSGRQQMLTTAVRDVVFPTPTAKDANGPWHTTHSPSLNVVVTAFPTPRALSLCGGSGAYQQIKGNPNLTDEEKRGLTSTHGQLNPDWEEWLMAWPVGWTDLETPNIRLVWLDPSVDPADYGEIPRITNRRGNRPARVKEIGNGQFPLTAATAFHWGLCVLQLVNNGEK